MSNLAIWKDGHWELVDDIRGENIPMPYQRMDLEERKRIIAQRWKYLKFMEEHFADRVVQPPAGVEVVPVSHGHGH